VTDQEILMVSPAALLTTEKVVLHSMTPALEALKIPASVIAPVPTPGPNDAVYVTVLATAEALPEKACRDPPIGDCRVVSPDTGAVVPVPTSMCVITELEVPIIRLVMKFLPT